MQKKPDWAKNSLFVKNPQFWLYPHETWSKEQPHEVVIFTKFHEDRAKTVDFLLLVNFWPSPVFLPQSLSIHRVDIHTIATSL